MVRLMPADFARELRRLFRVLGSFFFATAPVKREPQVIITRLARVLSLSEAKSFIACLWLSL